MADAPEKPRDDLLLKPTPFVVCDATVVSIDDHALLPEPEHLPTPDALTTPLSQSFATRNRQRVLPLIHPVPDRGGTPRGLGDHLLRREQQQHVGADDDKGSFEIIDALLSTTRSLSKSPIPGSPRLTARQPKAEATQQQATPISFLPPISARSPTSSLPGAIPALRGGKLRAVKDSNSNSASSIDEAEINHRREVLIALLQQQYQQAGVSPERRGQYERYEDDGSNPTLSMLLSHPQLIPTDLDELKRLLEIKAFDVAPNELLPSDSKLIVQPQRQLPLSSSSLSSRRASDTQEDDDEQQSTPTQLHVSNSLGRDLSSPTQSAFRPTGHTGTIPPRLPPLPRINTPSHEDHKAIGADVLTRDATGSPNPHTRDFGRLHGIGHEHGTKGLDDNTAAISDVQLKCASPRFGPLAEPLSAPVSPHSKRSARVNKDVFDFRPETTATSHRIDGPQHINALRHNMSNKDAVQSQEYLLMSHSSVLHNDSSSDLNQSTHELTASRVNSNPAENHVLVFDSAMIHEAPTQSSGVAPSRIFEDTPHKMTQTSTAERSKSPFRPFDSFAAGMRDTLQSLMLPNQPSRSPSPSAVRILESTRPRSKFVGDIRGLPHVSTEDEKHKIKEIRTLLLSIDLPLTPKYPTTVPVRATEPGSENTEPDIEVIVTMPQQEEQEPQIPDPTPPRTPSPIIVQELLEPALDIVEPVLDIVEPEPEVITIQELPPVIEIPPVVEAEPIVEAPPIEEPIIIPEAIVEPVLIVEVRTAFSIASSASYPYC